MNTLIKLWPGEDSLSGTNPDPDANLSKKYAIVNHVYTHTIKDREWGNFTFVRDIIIYCYRKDNNRKHKTITIEKVTFHFRFDPAASDWVVARPRIPNLRELVQGIDADVEPMYWHGIDFCLFFIKKSTYDKYYPRYCCCCGCRSTPTRRAILWLITPFVKCWYPFFSMIRGYINNRTFFVVDVDAQFDTTRPMKPKINSLFWDDNVPKNLAQRNVETNYRNRIVHLYN